MEKMSENDIKREKNTVQPMLKSTAEKRPFFALKGHFKKPSLIYKSNPPLDKCYLWIKVIFWLSLSSPLFTGFAVFRKEKIVKENKRREMNRERKGNK